MRGSGIFHAVFPYPTAPDTRGRACPAGHFLRRLSQCRFRLSPGNARGEAPCIRKLKIPPSQWEGGWGDGGRKASQKQGWQATRKARPSPGNGKARSASEAENSFKSPPAHPCPRWALAPQAPPMPLPAQPRGCKGRSPLHKKTKNPPFPMGRGLGGWGQKSKSKTGLAGDKEGTPLAGQRQGKVSQRGGELFQESPGASLPPLGTCSAGSANAASGSAPGMQGAKPLA